MEYKSMREYSHEEFVDLILSLSEEEILELSSKYGGYPVLFRMALDDRICHIPFIQTGAAIIIRNESGQILLQERTDRNKWGLPGGCQDLGEDLRLTAVREAYEETGIKLNPSSKFMYIFGIFIPNFSHSSEVISLNAGQGNTSLYLADVTLTDSSNLKGDSETKHLKFFYPDRIPENIMDSDLIHAYIDYIKKKHL